MIKYASFFYKKNLFSALFFLVVLILFFYSLNPKQVKAQTYNPKLNWQVLESEHFSVIFPGKSPMEENFNYQQTAVQVANIAEETYYQITPQIGEPFNPDKKVTIILEDFSDSVYGLATPFPHPSIRMNLTPPGYKIFDTRFESWLKILIAHEYTHIAHFDMTGSITSLLRHFMGQIIAPNALQPPWAIEGLAIYNESKFSRGGRISDNRYDMYIRTDFLEDNIKGKDNIQGSYLVSWPGGNTPYIYGQSLVHFIVILYGEDKLIEISEEFCKHPYLGMNYTLKKVLGIKLDELFELWQNEQKEKYFKQYEQTIDNFELTKSEKLTDNRYWVDDPFWITGKETDNKSYNLLYKVYTPELYSTIRQYDIHAKEENILVKRTSGYGAGYSLSPDQKYLIYSRLNQYERYNSYYDLFLYCLDNGKQLRISEGLRIKDPSWHPEISKNILAAVINKAGSNNLVIFSLNNHYLNKLSDNESTASVYTTEKQWNYNYDELSFDDLIFLTDFEDGTNISQPVWSPKGNKIAFSMWQQGYQDIYVINLDNNFRIISIKPITLDRHTDISPTWSPDGRYLYFSSDRTGIFNLYAYQLEDEKLFRLTNVITGAFEPAISPDGKNMAFIEYHTTGYELHLTSTDQLLWHLVSQTKDDSLFQVLVPVIRNNVLCSREKEVNTGDKQRTVPCVKEYSAWDSIIPTYWTPYISLNSNDLYLGFSSIAQDKLKFYSIPFTLSKGLMNQSIYYDLNFADYYHYPTLSLSLQGETSISSKFNTSLTFYNEGYTSQQDSSRYYHKNYSLGFQHEWYKFDNGNNEEKENTIKANSSVENINSLIFKYLYNDTESYQSSVGTEIGNRLSLTFQHANEIIGSDITFNRFILDARKYYPLQKNNSIFALRLMAGSTSEDLNEDLQFHLGGSQSSISLNSFETTYFPLRGYGKSSFIGNQLILANLEYRFPIKTIEHKIGFDWASVFLERISGSLFLDIGNAWEGNQPIEQIKENYCSIGAEVNFKFKLSYDNPFILTVGGGKALNEPSPFEIYTQIGISF